ncbi:MAG: M13 family metallopeptidase, partial [Paramuribaculum sp.]|nr:M13 family metallopeptidase [Paramuribaculum sp.]
MTVTAAMGMPAVAQSTEPAPAQHMFSLDPAQLDPTIEPGTDFYEYVTRKWQLANPLTDEHSRYGRFDVLSDSNELRVKEIVLGLAATNPQPGTVAYKVSTIYEQAMDSLRRNNEGAAPIQADLKRIEDTKHEDMKELFYWMHGNYASPFFGAGIQEDLNNSTQYAMYVSGGGLSLGDRDYYLSNDPENVKIRKALEKLIVSQMMNAGYNKKTANRIMKNVMKIETAIAEETWTREESRNLPAMNNIRSMAELSEMYPNINWPEFFVETM